MAVKTTVQLKEQFAAGKHPTAKDYADLIDSLVGSSRIEPFTNESSMFSDSKPIGAIEVFVNDNANDTTISVPTYDSNNTTFNIPRCGAVAFIKINSASNYWSPIALPIQQGGPDGDLGNS